MVYVVVVAVSDAVVIVAVAAVDVQAVGNRSAVDA